MNEKATREFANKVERSAQVSAVDSGRRATYMAPTVFDLSMKGTEAKPSPTRFESSTPAGS